MANNYTALYEMAASLLPTGSKVVELGCGNGALLGSIYHKRINYVGVDIDDEAVRVARENWNTSGVVSTSDIRFAIADITSTPEIYVEAATFISLEVLEHLDWDKDLHVLSQIRKGCRVIFSVPSFDSEDHKRFFPNEWDAIKRYSTVLQIDMWRKISLPTGGGYFHLMRGFK